MAEPVLSDGEREVILAELATLRDEALHRMDHRVTLLTTSLFVTTAMLGVGIERKSAVLLLVVPLIACLFGLLVAYHHRAIREIGAFIREEIDLRLLRAYPGTPQWHPSRSSANRRAAELLFVWHVPIVAATLVPSAAGLGLAYAQPAPSYAAALATIDVLALAGYLLTYLAATRLTA